MIYAFTAKETQFLFSLFVLDFSGYSFSSDSKNGRLFHTIASKMAFNAVLGSNGTANAISTMFDLSISIVIFFFMLNSIHIISRAKLSLPPIFCWRSQLWSALAC